MTKEQVTEKRNTLPIQASGIGRRIKEVADTFDTRKQAASVAGVTTDTLQRWFKEDASPGFESIARLAMEAGYYLEWIMTGNGSKTRGDENTYNPDIKAEVANGIMEAMAEEKLVDSDKLGLIREFIDIYNCSVDRPSPSTYRKQVLLRLIKRMRDGIFNFDRMVEQYSSQPDSQKHFIEGKKISLNELARLERELKDLYSDSNKSC